MFLLTAELKQLLSVQSGIGKTSGQAWKKQDALLTIGGDTSYPKELMVSFWGKEMLAQLSRLTPGTTFTLSAEASSREYNGRYYTEVRAIRLQESKDTGIGKSAPAAPRKAPAPPVAEEEEAPLPF